MPNTPIVIVEIDWKCEISGYVRVDDYTIKADGVLFTRSQLYERDRTLYDRVEKLIAVRAQADYERWKDRF